MSRTTGLTPKRKPPGPIPANGPFPFRRTRGIPMDALAGTWTHV